MAKKKSLTVTPELLASDVQVAIYPRDVSLWRGGAEQLKAEGLIPETFEWPEGTQFKTWEADGFSYCLGRRRPPAFKGPMKAWATGDWWQLNVSLSSQKGRGSADGLIYEKKRELELALWRQTSSYNEMFRKYWKAQRDGAFQRFLERAIYVSSDAAAV